MKTRNFKLNKILLIGLALFVTAGLFLFGQHGTSGATESISMAATAAITLTDAEKDGFSETEQKVILAMKKMTHQYQDELKKGLWTETEVRAAIKEMKDGLTTSEIKSLTDEIKKLEDAAKEQGKALKALQELEGKEELYSFEKAWEENVGELQNIREQGSGFKTFYFGDFDPKKAKKAAGDDDDQEGKNGKKNYVTGIKTLYRKNAGVTSYANSTSSNPAQITNPYSPFPGWSADVVAVRRNPNFILNYIDLGSTNSARWGWTEEGNSEGDAAVTAEGSVNPLQDKKFIDRTSNAKRVSGMITITEEMDEDTPRIATAVRRLFEQNVMRKYDDQVYADLIGVAPGYTLTALNDQIANADTYAAIGAAITQVMSLNGLPDLIALNPADKWKMRLTKGTDGQYVLPPFKLGENTYDGMNVVLSNKVAPGYFLVGESKTYKVDEYKAYSLRVGWNADDFSKNQYSAVGEIRFHSYIATNDLVAWCYASFATVLAAIEKV